MTGNTKPMRTECTEKDIWLFSTGNIANCLIFNMVGLYIMYYYTNILGVSAAVAGTIFMVARLVDAFTDPLMGMVVDRTNTRRMGKYRPFITYGAPFLGIAFVLLFTTPNISPQGKVIYAYISYIFYSLTWTCVQIPQLALPIMLSNNVARRTRIQAVFQFCGAIAGLVIQSYALPMIEACGGQDNPLAWTKVIVGYSVAATVLFILSALSVKNLDVYEFHAANGKSAGGNKVSLSQVVNAVFKNRALMCVLLAYGTDMFASQITNSMRIYFYKYNMGGRTDLMVWFGWVGTIASVLMLFFVGSYVKKLGKRWGIALVEALCLVCSVVVLVAAPEYLKEEHFLDRERKIVNWREVSRLPLITLNKGHALRSCVDVLYKNAGLKPDIFLESHSNMLSYRLAAQGLGIAVVPEITLELMEGSMKAEAYHLSESPITWEVQALYREGCYIGQVEQALLDIIRTTLAAHKKKL